MNNHAKPVFVFSASWRSGSTLIQRYITASGEVLVWGETGGALDSICDALSGWEQSAADGSRRFPNGFGGEGEKAYRQFSRSAKSEHALQWIANLTPSYAELLDHMRDTLTTIYGTRALAHGYPRFGIKETRCDLRTALRLKSIFPDARFVFLVRNPIDVMLSLKRRDWMGRPQCHATLREFARHWKNRAEQFRQAGFGFMLRYEDFVAKPELRSQLMDYLDIDNRPEPDFVQSSLVDWEAKNQSRLNAWERGRLHHWLGGEMKHWDYQRA
jgi:hypothetical protein